MRVIGGKAKGMRLKPVPGSGTRPITDRVKENIFNILAPDIPGCTFLDMFAGTGAVGIEALSRGASHATFLELNPRAIAIIKENLATTGFAQCATIRRVDAFQFLETHTEGFDIIYVAPPQYKELWQQALMLLDRQVHLVIDLVVVQIHPKEHKPLSLANLNLFDTRKYGSTLVCFYERSGEAEHTTT